MSRNVCRRRNKARVVRTVRVRKRISIARGNWLTISIRCGVAWMRTRDATATASNNSRAINNKDNSKGSRANAVNKANVDNKANRARIKVNNKAVNSKVVHKTANHTL